MENSGEISGVALVEQPHGGALLKGGLPGNKGGTGRPKEEIRALCASNLDLASQMIAKKLAEDPDLTIDQIIKAADISGKYSIGTKNEVTLNNAQLVDVIFRAFGDEFDKLNIFMEEEVRKELFERVALVADGVK